MSRLFNSVSAECLRAEQKCDEGFRVWLCAGFVSGGSPCELDTELCGDCQLSVLKTPVLGHQVVPCGSGLQGAFPSCLQSA